MVESEYALSNPFKPSLDLTRDSKWFTLVKCEDFHFKS
jgi:hypothetical protein